MKFRFQIDQPFELLFFWKGTAGWVGRKDSNNPSEVKCYRPFRREMGWGCSSVEHVFSMYKVLDSTPSTGEKQNKTKQKITTIIEIMCDKS